jgi:hypothetical protein
MIYVLHDLGEDHSFLGGRHIMPMWVWSCGRIGGTITTTITMITPYILMDLEGLYTFSSIYTALDHIQTYFIPFLFTPFHPFLPLSP